MGLELFSNDEMQGFAATKAAAKADCKPLEGRGRVYILPDRDEGRGALRKGRMRNPGEFCQTWHS